MIIIQMPIIISYTYNDWHLYYYQSQYLLNLIKRAIMVATRISNKIDNE
jgi:hypothetical protein